MQLFAIILSLLLAAIKSAKFLPNNLSEFELERQVKAGDPAALAERERRALLPTYQALQYAKEVTISVLLAVLLLTAYASAPAVGALLMALYFAAAYSIAARGWLTGLVGKLQRWLELRFGRHVAKISPLFAWLAPKRVGGAAATIASRDELRQLIKEDTRLLSPDDKARMLGAFDFGSLLVGDAMVPREHIKTVDIKETVGPVLLDRLHKDGHNMYPVIKKDIDHIKGWLYMSDLTPLDPDIKDVKDALRPTVQYVPVHALLQDVLGAALKTGRQLFIVVDDEGATKGLVSLADALAYLMGQPLPKTALVTTKP